MQDTLTGFHMVWIQRPIQAPIKRPIQAPIYMLRNKNRNRINAGLIEIVSWAPKNDLNAISIRLEYDFNAISPNIFRNLETRSRIKIVLKSY